MVRVHGGGHEKTEQLAQEKDLKVDRNAKMPSPKKIATMSAAEEATGASRELDDECAQCHVRGADAVNRPCGHRLMCMPCALAYRSTGDRQCCNVCLKPSTVEPFQPREPELVCVVCSESWGPRAMFIPGSCGHVLCVGWCVGVIVPWDGACVG